jgi:hypothetical protein
MGSCLPRVFSAPSSALELPQREIAEDELRQQTVVTLRIQAVYELPIVEVRIELPTGAKPLSTQLTSPGTQRFGSSVSDFGDATEGEPARIEVKNGRIELNDFHNLSFMMRQPDARAGDTLTFPVRLVLSDSSEVEWSGPPGSERPAPTLLVVRSHHRFGVSAVSTAAEMALFTLLLMGAHQFTRWRRQSDRGMKRVRRHVGSGLSDP